MAPTKTFSESDVDNPRNQQSSAIAPSENHQDEQASKDSKFKALWDGQISAKIPAFAYSEVHVLFLSWHPDDDDLHVEQEVKELDDVFRNTFGYKTTQRILKQDPDKSPQNQITFFLAEFVLKHDHRDNLLIIYYAGHGKLGDSGRGLNLTGAKSIPDANKDLHEIVWNSAEHSIQHTFGDVLVIFDCCNAGEMERNVRGSAFTRKAFEYMAATSHNSTTRKPGPNSFTTALIWALKEMIRRKPGKRFSTQELLSQIYKAPNFPDNQSPRLIEGGLTPCLRKIVLGPVDFEHGLEYDEEDSAPSQKVTQNFLNLRFAFDRAITTKTVKGLAKDISHLMSQRDLGISTVLWEGINSARADLTARDIQRVKSAASVWQDYTKKRRTQSSSSMEIPPISPVSPTVTSPTEPTPHDLPMSPTETSSNISIRDESSKSPAPDIGTDSGATHAEDDSSQTSKKRKYDDGELHGSESITTASGRLAPPREKKVKTSRHRRPKSRASAPPK
ncbi:homeobox domain containing protein [Rutstroemia sp. NJR-2017a WRK4]|nr:homeobox domain containing protein [Rutstroemia sp. NJR-2017a WRK4]